MKIFIIVGTRPEYIKLAPVYLEFQSLNKLAENGTVAKRTSSRLRRTNDRSVRVISSDAENASHVNGSYSSKQKYKLDLSSLHEDHEDDENAGIGVSLHLDGRVAKRTSSRLRRTNDRSVLRVHEDHEDDENAGIGVSLHAHNIFNTGNTGIDALFKAQSIINSKNLEFENSTILEKDSRKEFKLDGTVAKKYILITSHRRENIDNGFQKALCKSIFEILQEKNKRNSEKELVSNAEEVVEFIVCLHSNPQARENFLKLSEKLLSMNISGLNLMESVTYSGFIQLMQNAFFIITDSGGVQEEAAYLSKYTLVMREEAEREEYLEQGVSERLSPDSKNIKLAIESLISRLMNNSQAEVRPQLHSFYGNGDAAEKIVKEVMNFKDLKSLKNEKL
jgi:UDP-N-acetylglucosamine 2-epimerase (non-hydrolysing)